MTQERWGGEKKQWRRKREPGGSNPSTGEVEQGRSQVQSHLRLTGPNLVTEEGREREWVGGKEKRKKETLSQPRRAYGYMITKYSVGLWKRTRGNMLRVHSVSILVHLFWHVLITSKSCLIGENSGQDVWKIFVLSSQFICRLKMFPKIKSARRNGCQVTLNS